MKFLENITRIRLLEFGGDWDYRLFQIFYRNLTPAKEVMFLPGFGCEFVCEFVREQDNSKLYGRIFKVFSGYV